MSNNPLGGLSDVDGRSLLPHVPNPLAKDTKNYLVEYGVRIDDGAMVFHFFVPKDRNDWDPAYAMDKRLERAIPACFSVERVSADFAREMNSFNVIVGGLGASPDPWPLVEKFFQALDGSPAGAS